MVRLGFRVGRGGSRAPDRGEEEKPGPRTNVSVCGCLCVRRGVGGGVQGEACVEGSGPRSCLSVCAGLCV